MSPTSSRGFIAMTVTLLAPAICGAQTAPPPNELMGSPLVTTNTWIDFRPSRDPSLAFYAGGFAKISGDGEVLINWDKVRDAARGCYADKDPRGDPVTCAFAQALVKVRDGQERDLP